MEDLYCDDELNGDDPNMQLQIAAQTAGSADEAGLKDGASSDGANRDRYPRYPMLIDQGEKNKGVILHA